jgi:hypothetical protein
MEMWLILIIIGVTGLLTLVFVPFIGDTKKDFAILGCFILLILCLGALAAKQIIKIKECNYLIIDNETKKHWILENKSLYYENQNRIGFEDNNNNIIYLNRPFVVKIKQPLNEFRLDYKEKYLDIETNKNE